jgi:hypothetical protein
VELDTKKIEASLKTNPIPFGTRYGWTFLVGIIALPVFWGIFNSHVSEKKDLTFIDSPQINDLYVVNVAKMTNKTDNQYKYGIMKVDGFSGEGMMLKVSKIVYNKVSGPTKDISSGKAIMDDYYEPGTISLPTYRIKSMREEGSIESVHRQ